MSSLPEKSRLSAICFADAEEDDKEEEEEKEVSASGCVDAAAAAAGRRSAGYRNAEDRVLLPSREGLGLGAQLFPTLSSVFEQQPTTFRNNTHNQIQHFAVQDETVDPCPAPDPF